MKKLILLGIGTAVLYRLSKNKNMNETVISWVEKAKHNPIVERFLGKTAK